MKQIMVVNILILFVLNSCSNTMEKNIKYNDAYCNDLQYAINDSINKFWVKHDKQILQSTMVVVDLAIANCSDKNSLIESKVLLFRLLKEYNKGISYVESLPDSAFIWGYRKSYQLKTFYCLKCNEQNDTTCRNKYIRNIVEELELLYEDLKTGSNNNMDILMDYYLIRVAIEDKEKLINEISKLTLEEHMKNDLIQSVKTFDLKKFYNEY